MRSNTFGKAFSITTFGESHGPVIGVVIDGCPSGLKLDMNFIQTQLSRRRPGQSHITTSRNEKDHVEVLSGVFNGLTTGAPLTMIIKNEDARSKDYSNLKDVYRPGHADFTYDQKFGIRDYKGGGRSSARETAARVMAGGVAQLILSSYGIKVISYVDQVGDILLKGNQINVERADVDRSLVRCPNHDIASRMEHLIDEIRKSGDSIGGVIKCIISGLPVGLGEPVFDKLHADLGKAMLGINACKGFEIGKGFEAASMKGSEHNDQFEVVNESIVTKSNNSGGVLGGISNGMDVYFRCAFKPVATISKTQQTIDLEGKERSVFAKGRHDPCVVPRAVPIVESMASIVIVDHLLRDRMTKLHP